MIVKFFSKKKRKESNVPEKKEKQNKTDEHFPERTESNTPF